MGNLKSMHGRATLGVLSALVVLVIGLTACEEEVFVERPIFEDPPDTQFNFLGYFDRAEKLTTCGNCHVGQQAGWEETAHADAWAGLQSSAGAQEFCEGCHTVSELGNALEEPAGYNLVADERYQDVQCESCHGSGFEHVQNPDATQPLAPALVDIDLTTGCGECHSDTHHPFVEEWAQSPHAKPWGQFFPGAGDEECTSCAAARPECQSCHRGQQVLAAFGENANYLEKDDPEHLAITCAVCHDPHDADNEHQLRFPVATASIETHLCAQCHNRRTAPDPNSSHGLEPHSPESALLVGDAGWFAPGSNIDQGQIRGTHGSEANPTLCAKCHLSTFEVTDSETGDFVINATGHLFRPIPCLDAQGAPLPFENDCEISTTARSFEACVDGGCHGDEQAAFSALNAATTRIQNAADDLLGQLEIVDPGLEDADPPIDPADPEFTVAEGALFNYHLAVFGNEVFGTNTVVGSTAHNPFLTEALLLSSIDAVFDEYGVSPPAAPANTDWEAKVQEVLDRVGR